MTELPEGFDCTIIVPEIWANKVMDYPQCTRAIYWLGVDAFAGWTPAWFHIQRAVICHLFNISAVDVAEENVADSGSSFSTECDPAVTEPPHFQLFKNPFNDRVNDSFCCFPGI